MVQRLLVPRHARVSADAAGAIRVIMPSGDGQGRDDADVRAASPRSLLPSRRLRVLSHLARVALIMNRRRAGGKSMSDQNVARREVIKKAVYVTPVLLTLKANLEFASAGSGLPVRHDQGFTGGLGQPTPVEPAPSKSETVPPESRTVPPASAAPAGSLPPPRHEPPPAGLALAPSDPPAPVSFEPPPAENAGPDDAASPPQHAPAADHPGKRRRRGRRHWHFL
jgi:hypothetical protein